MLRSDEKQRLIEDIKKKKELTSIDSKLVLKELDLFFRRNEKIASEITSNPKSSLYKQTIKGVRSSLRRVHGLFSTGNNKERDDLLSEVNSIADIDLIKQILQLHSSTDERLLFYGEVYKKIFAITGFPQKILDLGCGINPLSVAFMSKIPQKYFAYDINEKEMAFVRGFFEKLSMDGNTKVMDLHHLKKLPRVDLAFLFKVTDILDRGKGHKKTEEVLVKIPANLNIMCFLA